MAIHNQTSRRRHVGTRRPTQDRQMVDRQFNPRRYAAQAIQSFSARLRDQIDLDTPHQRAGRRRSADDAANPGIHLAPLRIGLNTEAPTRGQLPSGLIHVEEANILGTTRSASTRLHDPYQVTPAQQVRELLRVGDRLISVAVVYARLSAALIWVFAG